MLTDFGKNLRKLRIERQELMRDMAMKLGVSTAYLSAVETGKRKAPETWIKVIRKAYSLSDEAFAVLKAAYDQSATEVKISLSNTTNMRRETAISFAKALDGLDDEALKRIMSIIETNNKGE